MSNNETGFENSWDVSGRFQSPAGRRGVVLGRQMIRRAAEDLARGGRLLNVQNITEGDLSSARRIVEESDV